LEFERYYGVALSNNDWRVKKLRGNEFGELPTAPSCCFALLPHFRKLAIAI
jgi:hypothetical protein